MTEKLPDVWTDRDFPVLREATRLIDRGESASIWTLEKATGLTLTEVAAAILALERVGLVAADRRGTSAAGITSVAGEAYQLTGLHPDTADPVGRLVAALLQAAEDADDEADKSRLRKAAGAIGEVSKSVAAGVLTALISGGLGS